MKTRHCALLFTAMFLAGCGADPQGLSPAADPVRSAPSVTTDPCSSGGSPDRVLHVTSPDWRDQVVYMIFIDRFNDGDPSNNDMGRGEYRADSPAHFNGGDLQGIIDKLPYLKELGVTAVWISPPVMNQWWSTPYQAAGWHGYWAVNFRELDPHFGSLDTYRELSDRLHCNGMYLIQDIVANHTGNFYAWDGPYNPDDPTENFYLIEEGQTDQVAPVQFPFDQIDVRNPEHRKVNAYHWTPELTDYDDPEKQKYYSLGLLADVNTENPLVLDVFKDTYRYWIEEVGVDGYRIDTVIYVDPPFWRHLLHDEDGIYAAAAATGRDHFLTFGEVFVPSQPFESDGEQKILDYFGTESEPGLNSMLGFPLYFSIRRVLSEGQPAAQLAYRLEQHMKQYPDPYVIPTFIDNHDTARFLATGGREALAQGLALIFTIPGLPVLFQGTEQGLTETRQAMFEGGWSGEPGIFDTGSDSFRLIQQLVSLRTGNRIFTRGSLQILAGDELNAGLLAYRRDHENQSIIVLMNTADHAILVNRLDTGVGQNRMLEPVFSLNHEGAVETDASGRLNLTLPARAVLVLRPAAQSGPGGEAAGEITMNVDPLPSSQPFESDFALSGSIGEPGASMMLIVDGDLDRATPFDADEAGNWRVVVTVRDLGESSHHLQVYAPESNTVSEPVAYATRVTKATIDISQPDPTGDARGPSGAYVIPQHTASGQQRDIENVAVRAAGRNLELTLTIAEISEIWVPTNGFDNVAITTFFGFPNRQGARQLPRINAVMPDGYGWNLAHVATGWVSYTYTSEGATGRRQGTKLGVSPEIRVDRENRTITFFFEGASLGVERWDGATVYITTWDLNGEGGYLPLQPEPSQWFFGGGEPDSPLILDDLLVVLPNPE